ncbi:hypothetical protein ZIOFF_063721 [Zingiber officinale]|uniref:Retrotransposon gag domain-containing protein n=1 Tax=Zingiber officinale TaxID=94328 RepID=A0A8J5F7H9_ZINOF|nr:hypothetical protein ZIOFF_063721 [Zingiber officinale]
MTTQLRGRRSMPGLIRIHGRYPPIPCTTYPNVECPLVTSSSPPSAYSLSSYSNSWPPLRSPPEVALRAMNSLGFELNGTSDNAKVELASINLEGDAIQWYDWLEACHGPSKWEEFKEELINRFGPSGYENVDGELAKIRQTSTVVEYQGRFERLSNQIRDWSEKQLLGTFIEGLRLDIRQEVKMNQPRTMKAALSFARLQEEKINEEGRRNNKVIRENPSYYSTPRRLTKEEIKERMAKGLCWHCDEKWHSGHQCKQKRILIIEPIENSEEEDDFHEDETQDNINEVHFGTTDVEYLGHIVSQNGVATDPSKVLVSKSIKALRDVLGLTDAFRWCLEAKKIFQNLKEVMMTTLVLALPNKQFVIEPDASEEKAIHRTKSMLAIAVEETYKELLPDQMVVVDLGCSSGPNTLLVLSHVLSVAVKLPTTMKL